MWNNTVSVLKNYLKEIKRRYMTSEDIAVAYFTWDQFFFFFSLKKREIQSNLSEELWLLVIYKLITVFVLYAVSSWYIFHTTLVL